MLQNYLDSLQYYLSQQLLTFCILPKFREQSGRHSHHQSTINSNMPSNPLNYSPQFYLVNKPPGEGKRDTGIN